MSPAQRTFTIVVVAGLAGLGGGALHARSAGGSARQATLAAEERAGVVETVKLFLRLSAHLQGSGGDPRFAERIPASSEVIEELLANVRFSNRVGRIEESRLQRVDVGEVAPIGTDRVEVATREYWVTRIISAAGSVMETRSDVVTARYVVQRAASGWRVVEWALTGDGSERGP